VTRRGKQAIPEADARKYDFLEVPIYFSYIQTNLQHHQTPAYQNAADLESAGNVLYTLSFR
jgi:hypothetical protein